MRCSTSADRARLTGARHSGNPIPRYAHRSNEHMMIPGLTLALEMSREHDAAMARRLQNKEPQAMADLYDRFGKLVYSVILSVVRQPSIAEDLVQETFLRVWNRAHAFEAGRGALGPWLLTLARNRAIDYLRSSGSRMQRNSYERDARDHPSLFVDMEKDVFNSDRARVIRREIAKLNDNQQKVI